MLLSFKPPTCTNHFVHRSLMCATGVRPNVLPENGSCRHFVAGGTARLWRCVRNARWEATACECNPDQPGLGAT